MDGDLLPEVHRAFFYRSEYYELILGGQNLIVEDINPAALGLLSLTPEQRQVVVGRPLSELPLMQGLRAMVLGQPDSRLAVPRHPLIVAVRQIMRELIGQVPISDPVTMSVSFAGRIIDVDILGALVNRIPYAQIRGRDRNDINGLLQIYSRNAVGGRINGDDQLDTYWASDGFLALIGYDADEFIQLGGFDAIVHSGDLAELRTRDLMIKSGMEVDDLDLKVFCKGSAVKYIRLSSIVTGRHLGHVQVTHFVYDRTQEVLNEYVIAKQDNEMRLQLERLAEFFRRLPFGTILIDAKGNILSRNPASIELSEEIIGQPNLYDNVYDNIRDPLTRISYEAELTIACEGFLTSLDYEAEDGEGNKTGRIMRVFFIPNYNREIGAYEAYAVTTDITDVENTRYRESALVDVISIMEKMLESADKTTSGHTERVSKLAENLCNFIGFNSLFVSMVKLGATLHDVGKILVRKDILNKNGKLTPDEQIEMRLHVKYPYPWFNKISTLKPLLRLIGNHHRNWDGTGYGYWDGEAEAESSGANMPVELKGFEIPIEARLFSLGDAWDAMRAIRPYNGPMTKDQALLEIVNCAGTQFDPYLAIIFVIEKLDSKYDYDYPEAIETVGSRKLLMNELGELMKRYDIKDSDLIEYGIDLVEFEKKLLKMFTSFYRDATTF